MPNSSPSIYALITARGGSKQIPGKNKRPLAGKPLIAWTIEAARASRKVGRVLVSTDDPEIAAIARHWGAETPFLRPAELAADDSPHIDTLIHALDWCQDYDSQQPDYMMTLQPTSPLRTTEDIDAAAKLAQIHQADAVVGVAEAVDHPWLCKRINEAGCLEPYGETGQGYLRRQVFPPAYAICGAMFLNRSESLRRDREFCPAGAIPYIVPQSRALDVNHPWDFHVAELVLGSFRAQNVA